MSARRVRCSARLFALSCFAAVSCGTSETADPIGEAEAASSVTAPDYATERCRSLEGELERREEAGELDEFAAGDELSEAESEGLVLNPPPLEAEVLAPGERPTFDTMPEHLDLAALDPDGLHLSIESCYETGLLGDDDDQFDEDDEEFCAEVATLSAEEVAHWVAEEGAEAVDEEFAFCDLARPEQ